MRPLVLLVVSGLCALPAFAQTLQPGWITDARTGCRVWNPYPQPRETVLWTGACSNGLAQGHGVVQWFEDGKASSRHDGEYRDGKANGRGVVTFASGSRYDGEFCDSKRNGRGVFIFANGARYDGQWRADKADGKGTKTSADGQVYSGTWTNGCFRQGNRWATVGATPEECGLSNTHTTNDAASVDDGCVVASVRAGLRPDVASGMDLQRPDWPWRVEPHSPAAGIRLEDAHQFKALVEVQDRPYARASLRNDP